MKNRVARKVVAGLLIWLTTAMAVAFFGILLPWNRLSMIPMAIAAWLVFRLVRERNPKSALDGLEIFGYFVALLVSITLVLALMFSM